MGPSLVWFRLDLRLADNPALHAALQRGQPIIPIFILAPDEEKPWAPGAASRWWLHHSLAELDKALHQYESRLILKFGPTLSTLQSVLHETKADAVYWNRRYEPALIKRDSAIKTSLRNSGVTAESFNANLLFEPGTLKTQAGHPFQVFTPFWKSCLNAPELAGPTARPTKIPSPKVWPNSEKLSAYTLEPEHSWANGLRETWQPGEKGAITQLNLFVTQKLGDYPDHRNRPDKAGSSKLSPFLHFGEVGPRQIWHAVQRRAAQGRGKGLFGGAEAYLREIGWREFAHHLLFHFPKTPTEPLHKEFARFPWEKNASMLRLWQKGLTGYPIVDAGMRELWKTGWMHNRVRMIAGSFLIKDLLLSWKEGAAWFWDTLVDADLANNTLGWQWVAGCGADAAPYYRVFNPTLQGDRFDPSGDYVRRWIPELHKAPGSYPAPVVDHAQAREKALSLFYKIRAH